MKNKLKKFLCATLALCIMAPLPHAFALQVGDKIEKVLSTDIVTYIEGICVPSFNIAGRTAVVVENLNAMNLPFSVSYDDASRTLTISDGSSGTRDYFHFADAVSDAPIGTPVMDVLYTDIETFYSEKKLQSFNIGGFTCVYATDFAEIYGRYSFNDETRTVEIFRQKDEQEGLAFSKDTSKKLPADESIIYLGDTFARWGSPSKSHLIQDSEGNYLAIEVSDSINIEKYDSDFKHLSSSKLKMELPIFGGFLAGEEFNYIVFGQENLKYSDTLAVLKIAVYDKDFKKVKDISVTDCKTSVPFDASNVSLAENDDYLIIHTARSQYADDTGMTPQTQLTVIVDKESLTVVNSLDKFQPNHTSHALKGYVQIDGDKIVTADLSDANPLRGIFIREMDFEGKLLSTNALFKVGGPAGANCTGTMLGGFGVSKNAYITAISSIDHSLATDYSDTRIEGIDREERDIFIISTDKNGKNLKSECLTYYSGENKTASEPYLVELQDGTFAVMWQKFSGTTNTSNTFCYAFIDKKGSLIGEPLQAEGQLSDSCMPIEADDKITWYVNTPSGRTFYQINTSYKESVSPDKD